MTQFEGQEENLNISFLKQIEGFVDILLTELLKQRSAMESNYYLSGFPVTDREILRVFQEELFPFEVSWELIEMWEELQEILLTKQVHSASPRMIQLRWFYSLNPMWILALMFTFCYETDPKYEKVFSLLQGDSGRKGPDVFLIKAIAALLGVGDETMQAELIKESKIKQELFLVSEKGELKLRKNVFLWLYEQEEIRVLGQDVFESYLLMGKPTGIFKQERMECESLIRTQIQGQKEETLVIWLQGKKGAGKKVFAGSVAEKFGYGICVLKAAALLEKRGEDRENILHEFFFSCRVNGKVPYIDFINVEPDDEECLRLIHKIEKGYSLLFFGSVADFTMIQKTEVSVRKLLLDKLSLEDSLLIWQRMKEYYPVAKDVDYEQMAGKYRLLPGMMKEVFVRAQEKCLKNNMEEISSNLLLSSIRECNRFVGNSLMERIDTVYSRKELRVEPQVISSMELACAHLKYRFKMEQAFGKQMPYGKGIGVLMYGPPGTGKTMAAQVMANELGMELYRVDLSQVTSKYVGETEKNLEKIFQEAEDANVILFFDEADSLFGKRTEVKDSNDKYANQETSYILQRIESYEGMVILATNLVKNFDPAFMRRITVSIHFQEPDENMRKLLWKDMLQNTDLAEDEILMENLAKQFEITGSNIKSIVRNAFFLSFMENRELQIKDIVKAVKIEFEKLGKIPNLSGFGMFFSYLSD